MIPNRLSVKFYIQNSNNVDLAAIKPIFYRWIQEHALEGLLIDVADYKHMADGPGIMLIGYEGDYTLDYRDLRHGVQYTRKKDRAEDLTALIQDTLRLATDAALKLAAEESVNLTFDFSEARIEFLDRLRYPNTAETLTALQDTLKAALDPLFGADATLEAANDDPRDVFAVRLKSPQAVDGTQIRDHLTLVQA